MKFKYTALNQNLKKLTGTLDTENQEEAKQILHKMGLSVIAINEITIEENQKEIKEEEKTGITTFYFEGTDVIGKEINGTIDAPDRFAAYQRLIEEYKFTITAIFKENISEEEKEASRKAGLKDFEEQIAKLMAEKKTKKGFLQFLNREASAEEESKILTEQSQAIQKEVDELVKKTKKILEDFGTQLSIKTLDDVKRTMDKLLLIKMSNNFPHIRELCAELINYIDPKEKENPIFGVFKKMESDEKKLLSREEALYHEAIKLSQMREGIKGLGERLKMFMQKSKGKEENKLSISELWILFSVRDPRMRTLLLAKNEAAHKIAALQKVLKKERDMEKHKELDSEIFELKNTVISFNKMIAKLESEKEKESIQLAEGIKRIFGWLLAFYIIIFFLAQYSRFIPVENIYVISGFLQNFFAYSYLPIFIIISFIIYIALSLKIRFELKGLLSNTLLSFIGALFFLVIIINI